MANITFHEEAITTIGVLPPVGNTAPAFVLIDTDLNNITLDNFKGKKKVLNIVPSLDTGICALSYVAFKKDLPSDVVLITISRDTPFAIKRYESDKDPQDNVYALSDLSRNFGKDYQCTMNSGPVAHLLSRAVIVLDEDNVIRYVEQVPEIVQEPNYNAVYEILKTL